MPVRPSLPTPFALYTDDITVSSATAITAGKAYFSGVVVTTPLIVTQMRCALSGSPTGNIDMGIYDSTGTNGQPNNLLGHTGAIAAATGVFTANLTANLTLTPGRYWLALVDTVADTVFMRNSGSAGMGVLMQSSASNLTVLPATAGTVSDSILRMAVMALLQSNFS